MKSIDFNIIPYNIDYEKALMVLEKRTPQGEYIKLEMIKPYFLSRSEVFDNYSIFLAVEKKTNKLIGVIAATILPLKINNKSEAIGFGYDFKVDPDYRNQGIAKKLEKYQIDHYFTKNSIYNYFTVAKSNNHPIKSVIYSIPNKMDVFHFLYLTIPTSKRVKLNRLKPSNQNFSIGLYTENKSLKKYIITGNYDLSAWRTLDSYKLRIQNMPWLLSIIYPWIKFIVPDKAAVLRKGFILNFVTLFNFNPQNIHGINEFLEKLQKDGIPYLNVCCVKNDFAHELLKPIALSSTPYSLFNTIGVKDGNHVGIDVRCL